MLDGRNGWGATRNVVMTGRERGPENEPKHVAERSALLPREVQDRLGQQLVAAYGNLSAVDLPPQLKELVAQLGRALTAGDPLAPEFRDAMLEALPNLRAYAISLTGNPDRADDCVQNAILKALKSRERFEAGTNMRAWLFTILRNSFFSEHRKWRREVQDTDGVYAAQLVSAPDQNVKLDLQDVQSALAMLPFEQRATLVLVASEGLSYDQVAEITGVAIGTVKSRISRARQHLAELMGIETADDLGSDRVMKSAVNGRPG
jgi:RNA polymerase sigma-70 factor, ECF subfamily